MKYLDLFECEREDGETRYDIQVFLSDDWLVRVYDEYYTGISILVYVGKYIALEPLQPRPHNVGYASREAAKARLLEDGYTPKALFEHDLVNSLFDYLEKSRIMKKTVEEADE